MEKQYFNVKKLILIAVCIFAVLVLCVSVGFNIYMGVFFMKQDSYLQSTDEIYVMEAGILRNNLEFAEGKQYKIEYDFTHENYALLKSRYNIESTAKEGTEFEKALRLMNEYAPRLTHKGDYDNHIPISALELLEYSLDKSNQGINCRNKAQILNEMCLALGIYSRKVWIMPYSRYDNDCHVVNEVWDRTLNKWVMLDITNNEYWVSENNIPLSVLEIRNKLALREFCTPVEAGDKTANLQKLKQKNIGDFLYIAKNMVYTQYCAQYTVGEAKEIYMLMPQNIPTKYELIIAKSSIDSSPLV